MNNYKQKFITFLSLLLIINFSIRSETKNNFQRKYSTPVGYFPGDPLQDHVVYLTFDDGPADWTPELLSILKKYNIKATFFLSGGYRSKYDGKLKNKLLLHNDTIKRMVKDGHVIGNHSASHRKFTGVTESEILFDLRKNQEFLYDVLGIQTPRMTLIRPPWGYPWLGDGSPEEHVIAARAVAKLGLVILWSKHFNSLDSKEWVKGDWFEENPRVEISEEEFQQKMEQTYHRLIKKSNGQGMVVLFHDTHLTTVKILPRIIEELQRRKYTFATMEDYVVWRWNMSSFQILKSRSTPAK